MGHNSTNNLRKRVLDIARRMIEEGLVQATWGNVSCRLPGEPFMIITPSGLDYLRLEIDDLVITDWEGNLVEGRWKPSTESRMHGLVYEFRTEVGGIVHTHSRCATAFAVAKQRIPVVTEEMAQVVGGSVEVGPYTVCGTQELANTAVMALGDRNAALLANHGLLAVGKNLDEALRVALVVERSAQIAYMAKVIGSCNEIDKDKVDKLYLSFMNDYGQKR
ncbi:MAG: class II aldolase/adducin family protein [Chitinophagales bacterium]